MHSDEIISGSAQLPNDQKEFLLNEADALRREAAATMNEIRTLERTVIAGIALIYSWAATEGSSWSVVWFVPIGLTAVGWYRSWLMYDHLGTLGAYLRKLELSFEVKGWEAFLRPNGMLVHKKARWLGEIGLWIVLCIACAGMIWYHSIHPSREKPPTVVEIRNPDGKPANYPGFNVVVSGSSNVPPTVTTRDAPLSIPKVSRKPR